MATLLKQLPPPEGAEFMGLEKEGLSVFPGVKTVLQIPIIHNRFNIGLDGDSEEVKYLRDTFENYFGVKFDTPEGQEWLANYEIVIDHDVTAYDNKNPKDMFDLHILRVNGGMGIVANSHEDIERAVLNTYKFIVVDEHHETTMRVKTRERRINALRELGTLYESNPERLILVAKYILGIGSGIADKTNAFDRLGNYIEQSPKNIDAFMETVKKDPTYLSVVIKVKEAIYRNIIRYVDGKYLLHATQTPLGRNEEEVIKFCLNPTNIDLVGVGMDDDSPTSISAQLKQFI